MLYKRIELLRKWNISDKILARLIEFDYVEICAVEGRKRFKILKDYNREELDCLIVQKKSIRMSKSIKELHKNKDWSDKRNESIRRAYESQELRDKISKSCKLTMSTDAYRDKRKRISKELWESKDFRNKMLALFNSEEHKIKLSKAIKASMTREVKRKIAENTRKGMTKEVLIQRHNTIVQNNSFKYSKGHKDCLELLNSLNISYEVEKLYPDSHLSCDVYIPDYDLWIEFHFDYYHNFKPYNYSEEHKKELEELLLKCTGQGKERKYWNQYDYVVYNWTELDIKRKELALLNELNWIAFYTKKDFVEWIETLTI